LEDLAGPSTSQTLEISAAITDFKAAGKSVIAVGDFYSQAHYLLASQADQMLLHPEGGMFLEGFSVYRSYLRRFSKRPGSPCMCSAPGRTSRPWNPISAMTCPRGSARWSPVGSKASGQPTPGWPSREDSYPRCAGSVHCILSEQLAASGNDLAQTMLEGGWVDALADHAEMETALAEWVGVTDEDGFAELIDFQRYVEDIKMGLALSEEACP